MPTHMYTVYMYVHTQRHVHASTHTHTHTHTHTYALSRRSNLIVSLWSSLSVNPSIASVDKIIGTEVITYISSIAVLGQTRNTLTTIYMYVRVTPLTKLKSAAKMFSAIKILWLEFPLNQCS